MAMDWVCGMCAWATSSEETMADHCDLMHPGVQMVPFAPTRKTVEPLVRWNVISDERLRAEAKKRGLWPRQDEDLANDLARANNESSKRLGYLKDISSLCVDFGMPEGIVAAAQFAWLKGALANAKTDGPAYNAGRSEGHADVAADLRRVLGPDAAKLNLDGLINRVKELVENPLMSVPASLPAHWAGVLVSPSAAQQINAARPEARRDLRERGSGLAGSMPESKPIDPLSWPDELDNLCDDEEPKR